MKKCPRCQKDIPQDAKICPYCGTPQAGYRPMKRTNRKPHFTMSLLIFLLVFSPIIFSYFLAFDSLKDQTKQEPDQSITLQPYQKTSQDIVAYHFDSLESFHKKVTNSQQYVQKINKVEEELQQVFGQERYISKKYAIDVTEANNVYFQLTYEIQINENETMLIDTSYDLSGENQCQIILTKDGLKSFDEMKITDDNNNQLLKDITYIFDQQDQYVVLGKTEQLFNDLQPQFEEQKEVLSHYGLGVSYDENGIKCAMRILSSKNSYRVKTTYETQLKINHFI